MELKPCDRSTIERALGIIEGTLLGENMPKRTIEVLCSALKMIDDVLNKEEPT